MVPKYVICVKKGNSKVLKVGETYFAYKAEKKIKKIKIAPLGKDKFEIIIKKCYNICFKTENSIHISIGIYDIKKFMTLAEWREKQINSIFE